MEDEFYFPPFRLDRREGRLSDGNRALALRPKTFALLEYLVARGGQLVSKRELLSALWPDVIVGEAALTVCVHELRGLLGDDPQNPRYIETLHRRGYRFVAPVLPAGSRHPGNRPLGAQPGDEPIFVGRDVEMVALASAWQAALAGARQLVFVLGEPGIGKTTLVDHFCANFDGPGGPLVGRGQCVELYGEGEAYLPLLEAIGRLGREAACGSFRDVLRRHAPTWVAHLPGLPDAGSEAAAAVSGSPARMLRELADALETSAAIRPLLLVVEDLHLSDASTIQFLNYLARRRGPARLLVIGTVRTGARRPGQVLADSLRELRRLNNCRQLRLEPLGEAEVAEYIRRRIGDEAMPQVAQRVHRRTEGHPLFMAGVIDRIRENGTAGEARRDPNQDLDGAIPESISEMIEGQLDYLSAHERRVLESASVAGVEFPAAALACETRSGAGAVEQTCEQLARGGGLLRRAGSILWPDGTVTARYVFRHMLYQEVLYHSIAAGRRAQLHRMIGDRLEAGYGERTSEIAGELAVHFERGCDFRRAATYLAAAAENALRRSANDAAIDYAQRALAAILSLPPTAERSRSEVMLQLLLGSALMARSGLAAPVVEQTYARAHELLKPLGALAATAPVLLGMAKLHVARVELDSAQTLATQALDLARAENNTGLELEAGTVMAAVRYSRGQFREALDCCTRALALYDPVRHHSHALLYGVEPGALAAIYAAITLWRLGFPDQARQRAAAALGLAEKQGHAHSLSLVLAGVVGIHECCGDWRRAEAQADRLLAHSAKNELPLWYAYGQMQQGRLRIAQGDPESGVALIMSGLAGLRATGGASRLSESASLLPRVRCGALSAGAALEIAEGGLMAIRRTGEATDQAELHRAIGILKLRRNDENARLEAESCFLAAIETARRQAALAYELRATLDLARLRLGAGDRARAREKLARVYGRFTEGFDTEDLRKAAGLMRQLES